jgi:GMP synthase-like glutamine amidotransferase
MIGSRITERNEDRMIKMNRKLVYLQHVPFENPGIILDWAAEKGFELNGIMMYDEPCLPLPEEYDWLVVMGGPMNIYEEEKYPWLEEEKAFIRSAIETGKVVLGLCLGAQLIAGVLGGRVTKNPQPEIGWLPVTMTEQALALPFFRHFPKEPTVFQWHGDTFSILPETVTLLAKSAACRHQAFSYQDRVFGFQFHLENTREVIQSLIENCRDEMTPGTYVQSEESILAHPEHIAQDNVWMKGFLNAVFAQQES